MKFQSWINPHLYTMRFRGFFLLLFIYINHKIRITDALPEQSCIYLRDVFTVQLFQNGTVVTKQHYLSKPSVSTVTSPLSEGHWVMGGVWSVDSDSFMRRFIRHKFARMVFRKVMTTLGRKYDDVTENMCRQQVWVCKEQLYSKNEAITRELIKPTNKRFWLSANVT